MHLNKETKRGTLWINCKGSLSLSQVHSPYQQPFVKILLFIIRELALMHLISSIWILLFQIITVIFGMLKLKKNENLRNVNCFTVKNKRLVW